VTLRGPSSTIGAVLAAAVLLGLTAGTVPAAEPLRVGKTIGVLWALTPVDVGVAQGFFAQNGLDVEISNLTGDTKLQQALISDSVDIGLAGSTGMVFALKGSPVVGIAALAGPPRNFSIVVGAASSITTPQGLRGKLLGISSSGSLVEWFAKRIATSEGWPVDAIKTVTTGGFEATVSALKTGQIDAFIGGTELGYRLEEGHEARIIGGMESFVTRFHTHVILAPQKLIADKPDTITRFLKGFFASVAFMKSHRDATIAITAKVLSMSPAVIGKTYDDEISMLSDDGAFDPQAIEVLKSSYVDMGILDKKPETAQLLTTQFTPVTP
jgi:NitT/TauT family transport system substrate-binding protein